jgi:hypothetical protein
VTFCVGAIHRNCAMSDSDYSSSSDDQEGNHAPFFLGNRPRGIGHSRAIPEAVVIPVKCECQAMMEVTLDQTEVVDEDESDSDRDAIDFSVYFDEIEAACPLCDGRFCLSDVTMRGRDYGSGTVDLQTLEGSVRGTVKARWTKHRHAAISSVDVRVRLVSAPTDVGKGQSTFVDTASRNVTIDVGTSGNAARVAAQVNAAGRGENAVIISHDDQDHAGGAARVLELLTELNIQVSFLTCDTVATPAPNRQVTSLWTDSHWSYSLSVPPKALVQDSKVDRRLNNSTSIVLFVHPAGSTIADSRVVICGDLNLRDVPLAGLGPIDVFSIPHHGSHVDACVRGDLPIANIYLVQGNPGARSDSAAHLAVVDKIVQLVRDGRWQAPAGRHWHDAPVIVFTKCKAAQSAVTLSVAGTQIAVISCAAHQCGNILLTHTFSWYRPEAPLWSINDATLQRSELSSTLGL